MVPTFFSVGGFSVSDALIYEFYPDIENSTAGDGVYFSDLN